MLSSKYEKGIYEKNQYSDNFSKKFFRRAIEQFKNAISNGIHSKYHLLYKIITSCEELEDEEELIRKYHFVTKYRRGNAAKRSEFGKILKIIANYYFVRQNYSEAYKFFERLAIFYGKTGNDKKLFRMYLNLGNHAYSRGRNRQRIAFYKKSLDGVFGFRKNTENRRELLKKVGIIKIKIKYIFRLIGISLLSSGKTQKGNAFFLKAKKMNRFKLTRQMRNEIKKSLAFLSS